MQSARGNATNSCDSCWRRASTFWLIVLSVKCCHMSRFSGCIFHTLSPHEAHMCCNANDPRIPKPSSALKCYYTLPACMDEISKRLIITTTVMTGPKKKCGKTIKLLSRKPLARVSWTICEKLALISRCLPPVVFERLRRMEIAFLALWENNISVAPEHAKVRDPA